MFLPRFNGDGNPESWIFRAELYFTYLGFSTKDWLPLPSFYLDGDALAWFNWLFRNNQFYDWNHFKEKFLLHFQKQTFADLQVNSTIQPPASLGSFTNLQVADIHDSNSSLTGGDKCALVEDKVFDEISQSDEPDLPCHCASDEGLLIPLVGHDHLVPSGIEPIVFPQSLSVEAEELPDATTLTSRKKSDLETEQVREAQVFAKSPHRNTHQTLSQFAPMVMDPFASLVLGDKFPFGQILVVYVSVNLDDGHMLETCYCCHRGACTYLYYASESSIGAITFCSRVDNWFDTEQDLEVGSWVLLSVESEELTQVSHEKSWLIPFHVCEYILLHDENFTIVYEISLGTKKSVPDEIFLIEFENPAWAAEFALIIKQPLLHDFQLVDRIWSCLNGR